MCISFSVSANKRTVHATSEHQTVGPQKLWTKAPGGHAHFTQLEGVQTRPGVPVSGTKG